MLIRSDQNKFHFVSQFSIAVGTDLFIPVLDARTHQASDNLSFSLHCLKSAMHMHTRKNPVTILVKQTWATDQLSTAATPPIPRPKKKKKNLAKLESKRASGGRESEKNERVREREMRGKAGEATTMGGREIER